MGPAELILILVIVGGPIAIIVFVVRSGKVKSKKVIFGFIGFLVGALIGFLLRPSAPFIGQLPLETVLSRGENLSGLDQLAARDKPCMRDMLIARPLHAFVRRLRGNWNESDIRTDAPWGRVETRLPGNHFAL